MITLQIFKAFLMFIIRSFFVIQINILENLQVNLLDIFLKRYRLIN